MISSNSMETALTKAEEKEVALVVKNAQELQVKTYEQVMDAADVLYQVKQIGEKITERKEEITKPLSEALKSARAFFKPFENQYTEAEAIVKDKVLEWHASHWSEQNVPDNTIHGLKGKVTVTERFKVEIEDADAIPRNLCNPDVERVQKALEAGLKVKGAKLVPVYGVTAGKN